MKKTAASLLILLVTATAGHAEGVNIYELRLLEDFYAELSVNELPPESSSLPISGIVLQHSSDLERWFTDGGATVDQMGGGLWEISSSTGEVPSRRFYRVIGLRGTFTDSDGDGLTNEFESGQLGSNTGLWDTDSDGVNDGDEFALGTDPLDASSFPTFITTRPSISFESLSSIGREGSPHQVVLSSDRQFNGNIEYEIDVDSTTATAGADYNSLSGSVTMSGHKATIDISFIDNLTIDETVYLSLKLKTPDDESYRRGGLFQHVIVIQDNDTYWSGMLRKSDNYNQRSFRMKMLIQGSTTTAFLVAGPGNDGLEDAYNDEASAPQSTSEGVVPTGEWQLGNVLLTPTSFTASSAVSGPQMMSSTAQSKLFGSQTIARVLEFSADRDQQQDPAFDNRIVGDFRETLFDPAAPNSFLRNAPANDAVSGFFIIVRDLDSIGTTP